MNNFKHFIAIKYILAAAFALSFGSARLPAGNVTTATVTLDQLLRPLNVVNDTELKKEEADEQIKEAEFLYLTKADLLDRLAEDINRSMDEGDEVHLSCRITLRSIRIPATAQWDVYSDEPYRPDSRGYWMPIVKVAVDGQVIKSFRLPLKAALFRNVYVAAHRLDRGESLEEPGVKKIISNIYEQRGSPIPADVNLSEYELVQVVPEGRLVTWNDVARRPDVRRGDMVEVVLKNGGLSISLAALSLENGIIGERVSLRNVRSRHEFSGIVAGNKKVEIIQ